MNYTKEQLREKFQTLPQKIKDVMIAVETVEKIIDITKKHKLHIDKMGVLSDEVSLVMMGLTRPNEFMYKIEKSLNVSSDLAKEITKEINEEIFIKIREELQNLRGFTSENKEESSSQSAETESNNEQIMVSQNTPEVPPEEPERNVFQEKMGGIFKSGKNEVIEEKNEENPQTKLDKEPPRHDPYREPPEE